MKVNKKHIKQMVSCDRWSSELCEIAGQILALPRFARSYNRAYVLHYVPGFAILASFLSQRHISAECCM
jgi:hypothetical protein